MPDKQFYIQLKTPDSEWAFILFHKEPTTADYRVLVAYLQEIIDTGSVKIANVTTHINKEAPNC